MWGGPDVDALKLTATLRLLGGDKSERASVEGVKSEKASVEGVTSPPQPHKNEEENKKEQGAIEIRIERPAGISRSLFKGLAAACLRD